MSRGLLRGVSSGDTSTRLESLNNISLNHYGGWVQRHADEKQCFVQGYARR